MEDLNLPIIDFDLPEGRPLSMDEYYEFCLLCLEAGFDREEYERQKLERCVTVPFRIPDDAERSSREEPASSAKTRRI